jgi:HPt (histidine-containing phosphotransfer) domain-containing protein
LTWTPAGLTHRLGGDRRLAGELVDIFLSEYPVLLQALRDAAVRSDADALRRAAHALKGSVLNFVDDGPAETASKVETAAAESRLTEVPALLAQLETEIQALVDAMRRYMERP